MRLLTHNTLRNNEKDGSKKGKTNGGFPLKITATEIKVVDQDLENRDRHISFVKGILPMLHWKALVQVRRTNTTNWLKTNLLSKGALEMGITSLPNEFTEEMANEDDFLIALYQVLMNVHLVRGILTCPDTGREFSVVDGIPNFVFDDDDEDD